MRLFYNPDIESTLSLPEEEAKHVSKVLRMEVGNELIVLDGKGNEFHCSIKELSKKTVKLSILNKTTHPKSVQSSHIVLAPTKNMDRIEWFVEKAVEIGIQEISFIQTKNSERKHLKLDRLQRIAISALKQSQQFHLPVLAELVKIQDFVDTHSSEHKFVAHQEEGGIRYLSDALHGPGDTTVLIGPEGDFTEEEITKVKASGYLPISLGNNRLRTETAALVACTELSLLARS